MRLREAVETHPPITYDAMHLVVPRLEALTTGDQRLGIVGGSFTKSDVTAKIVLLFLREGYGSNFDFVTLKATTPGQQTMSMKRPKNNQYLVGEPTFQARRLHRGW